MSNGIKTWLNQVLNLFSLGITIYELSRLQTDQKKVENCLIGFICDFQ